MAVAVLHRKAAFPVITALVVAGSLALFLLPDVAHLFMYDRDRVLEGEVWRLITGHAVHFSPSHTAYNLALFAVAGVWLERRNRPRYTGLIGLTALASGLYFLAFMPEMTRYGGLSGVVSAMVVYLCLGELRHRHSAQSIWAAILLTFAVKVGHEILAGEAIFARPDAILFTVAPSAHIIGAAVAVFQFCVSPGRWRPHSSPPRDAV